MNINTKWKHNNSNTHSHRKEYGIVVKKYETILPEIDEVDIILRNIFKDCRETFLHTSEYRFKYDVNFTNKEKNEIITLIFTHG